MVRPHPVLSKRQAWQHGHAGHRSPDSAQDNTEKAREKKGDHMQPTEEVERQRRSFFSRACIEANPLEDVRCTLGMTTASRVSLATSLMSSSPHGESRELILTTTAFRP